MTWALQREAARVLSTFHGGIMPSTTLTALCALDGRYADRLKPLQLTLSEFGLMHFRLLVEIRWFIALANESKIPELANLEKSSLQYLEALIDNFNLEDAERIKTIERKTNHDVKALEYFLQEKFSENPKLTPLISFIHFACTSEDINNLAYALMLKKSREEVILPSMQKIIDKIDFFAKKEAHLAMLSRTHGQTATPTTLGKEMKNFSQRLQRQRETFKNTPILGKINGAVGNFNAHLVAYPKINWLKFSQNFVEHLGLEWNSHTTQIEPHDFIAQLMDALSRFNTVLIDFNRDIWGYISIGYFQQEKIEQEVGSSTMPHKINPIDFENSEGNLGLANAISRHFSEKLPISRWQRDLSDSTVLRNLGLSLGYSYLAYLSVLKGLSKLSANEALIREDLEKHWEVLAEPLQTVMRRFGISDAYEQLKSLSRGKVLTEELYIEFVDQLSLPENVKKELRNLRPENYIGLAAELATFIVTK